MFTEYRLAKVYHLTSDHIDSDAAVLLEFETSVSESDAVLLRFLFSQHLKKHLSISCEVHTKATLEEKYPTTLAKLIDTKQEATYINTMVMLGSEINQRAQQKSSIRFASFSH